VGGVRRVHALGAYGPSDEKSTVWLPASGTEGAPVILVEHGTSAAGWSYTDTPAARAKIDYLCRMGFVVAVADYDFDSDPNVQAVRGTWNADESIAGNLLVLDWLADAYGANTDWVCIWGDSAGGATAMGMLWHHPELVAGVQTHQGAHDITAIRALNNPLINFLIDQAFHGNWAGAAATHDPALNTSLLEPYADRIRIHYTTGDGLIPTQSQINFADAVGCERVCMGAGDHGVGDLFSFAEQAAWFADRLGL
jgi:hypothetical protein